MTPIALLAGLLSGLVGSMGLGGGAVLLIYLTVFENTKQLNAQGINLIFFIPIGILAVIIYAAKRKIVWKKTIPIAIFGMLGSALGLYIVRLTGAGFASKLFAAFLIILGVKEVFSKTHLKKQQKNDMLKKE